MVICGGATWAPRPPPLLRQPWPQLSLLMTSLAIGQISLDVRTLNECFSVHYLCKLETKHPKHGLIIVYCLPSSILKQSSQIIISHHIKSLTAIKVNATFVGRDPATIYVYTDYGHPERK